MSKSQSSDVRLETDNVADGASMQISFSCSTCSYGGTVEDVRTLLARQRDHREQYDETHVLEFDRD